MMSAKGNQKSLKESAIKSVNGGKLEDGVIVAQITKSYNTTGEVIIKIIDPVLEEFNYKREPVFILFNELPVPFFIESFTQRGNNGAIIKFESIDNQKQSTEIISKKIYISKSSLSKKQIESIAENNLQNFIIGCTVADQNGKEIGRVIDYLEYSSNPCLEVELNQGILYSLTESNIGEFPFNEELLLGFDAQKRVIVLQIPEGLLIHQ